MFNFSILFLISILMELKVYNGEYFERWITWYIIFVLIILIVIVFSILASNYIWWILVLFISWWYFFFQTKTNNKVKLKIWDKALQIWKTPFLRDNLKWFVLEYDKEKSKINNIILLKSDNTSWIYTIADSVGNLENFVNELNEYIPLVDNFNQSLIDRVIRKIKL